MYALVNHGRDAVGFKDLDNDLLPILAQVKAAQAGPGLQLHGPSQVVSILRVERMRLATHGVVGQFVEMLADFDIGGVERPGAFERRTRRGLVAQQPVLGRLLDQRRDRMVAGHAGSQPVVGIRRIERCRLLKALHRLFKLAIEEELTGGEEELRGAPPIARARLPSLIRRSRGGRGCRYGRAGCCALT